MNDMHKLVVMGVSGCGKSTVGAALAGVLGAIFVDGDALHPPSNIAKMASGTPLDDDDRAPWLKLVGAELAKDGGRVIACSSLKRAYRDIIHSQEPAVFFVHLHGASAVLESRMQTRPGHFMPPALLQSQLATLEPLGQGEAGMMIDITLPLAAQIEAVRAALAAPH